MKGFKIVPLALAVSGSLALSGCNGFIQEMESDKSGVIFSHMPPFSVFGFRFGGVQDKVLGPGQSEVVWPWQTVYRLTTSVQSLVFGDPQAREKNPYVQTRTVDGNEVALAITVQYRVNPDRVGYIIQRVGLTDDDVRQLVSVTVRAYIRSFLNTLQTVEFREAAKRNEVISRLERALNDRLEPEGITIASVIYRDHRFERLKADGDIDTSYQDLIDRTQETAQRIELEIQDRAARIEEKRRQLAEAQGVTRAKEQIRDGILQQYQLRGTTALEVKRNAALQISERGRAEVEGLRKKIAALAGAGGRAQLRLELARLLAKTDPQFVILQGPAQGQAGLRLEQLDTNRLLELMLKNGTAPKQSGAGSDSPVHGEAPENAEPANGGPGAAPGK